MVAYTSTLEKLDFLSYGGKHALESVSFAFWSK